jgi:hypothetical protein
LIKAIVRSFLQVNSKNDDKLSSKKMMMMMMPMSGSRRRRRRMKSLSRHCVLVEKRKILPLKTSSSTYPRQLSSIVIHIQRENPNRRSHVVEYITSLLSLLPARFYLFILFDYFFLPHQYSLIQSIHTQVVDIHAYIHVYIYLIP